MKSQIIKGGGMFQKVVTNSGNLKVLGGAEINRYIIKEKIKGFVRKEELIDMKCFISKNSVLIQNIVAHIENPNDHIKIISATLDDNSNYVILDTINQLIPKEGISNKYICALLNSKFINWYVYRFVFGKAIRTMHFDNSTTEKIFVPRDFNSPLIKKIESKIEIIQSNKMLNQKGDTSSIENEIDLLIYQLYELSESQINIIENSFINQNILS